MSFLIYGANGYTGKLIVELSVKKGYKPILAGRTESKVKPLAQKYGLDYLVFSLDNYNGLVQNLTKFPLVLNCAGPFSRTAKPMIQACLEAKTHYLDITGEIDVFELVKSFHQKAIESNIILLPGVGFDVVPTDCMAKYLHTKMPDASHLELAFTSIGGSISHGTMTTMIESLGKSGFVRENGLIISKPTGYKGKLVDFGTLKQFAMTIPWGDISTAHFTTNIPNIETYFGGIPKFMYWSMKFQFLYNFILQTNFIKNMLQKYVDKNIEGPTESQLLNGKSLIYGKVTNVKGETNEGRLETMESYRLTAETALLITQKVLDLQGVAGYQTPAGMFGHELILEVEGSSFF
jgi:short subunit dehydrogenase-like uncharacterized protein